MLALLAAMMEPNTKNNGFRGAFWRGGDAFWRGEPIEACPYLDKWTSRGSVTFSRAFIRFWEDGWRAAEAEARREEQGEMAARRGP